MQMVREADIRKVIELLGREVESTDKTLLNVQFITVVVLFIAR